MPVRALSRAIGPSWRGGALHSTASLAAALLLLATTPCASQAQSRAERSSGVTFSTAGVGVGADELAVVTAPAGAGAAAPAAPAPAGAGAVESPRQAGMTVPGSATIRFASGSSATQAAGSPWWTPLASAALPGAGQAVLKQDRFVAYMAVEGYFWLRFYADRREGLRQRSAYRQLANDVARAGFSTEKPVGNFEYYERMEHFVESGVFDAVPGGSIQPETDTTTFNGSIWLLARRTYWTDPEVPPAAGSEAYLRAEALYRDRAVLPAFRWSWRDAQLEQDLYRRTISQSNEAFRRAVQDLGVVLANHVLSTVDAYVAVRLERTATPERDFGLSVTVPWEPTRR